MTDPDVQQKTAQCPGRRDGELCEVDDRQDHPAGPHDEDLHGEQVQRDRHAVAHSAGLPHNWVHHG